MDAVETVLMAATREFGNCAAWRPKLLAAWEQIAREQGKPEGWAERLIDSIAFNPLRKVS
jgi:hypothetical protein